MKYFLAKTDPETYALADLERDKKTVWDGVRNPQALKAIKEMQPGDRVYIYHSGGEAAIVGLAEVASPPRPDPRDPKLTVVDLVYRGRIEPPVTLRSIKASGQFNDWALVRQGRLSTMAVPEPFVKWIEQR
jgi:predicted RNA-binding protein with PUA-like domain